MDQPRYKLNKCIDEVLHYLWDPIGVAGIPEARDEYSSYVPSVWALLLRDASDKAIVDLLVSIETERMGLRPRPEVARQVVKVLRAWRRIATTDYR